MCGADQGRVLGQAPEAPPGPHGAPPEGRTQAPRQGATGRRSQQRRGLLGLPHPQAGGGRRREEDGPPPGQRQWRRAPRALRRRAGWKPRGPARRPRRQRGDVLLFPVKACVSGHHHLPAANAGEPAEGLQDPGQHQASGEPAIQPPGGAPATSQERAAQNQNPGVQGAGPPGQQPGLGWDHPPGRGVPR